MTIANAWINQHPVRATRAAAEDEGGERGVTRWRCTRKPSPGRLANKPAYPPLLYRSCARYELLGPILIASIPLQLFTPSQSSPWSPRWGGAEGETFCSTSCSPVYVPASLSLRG
jgi:hypothetical protein